MTRRRPDMAKAKAKPYPPALLELMKVRYTGAGPAALLLCKDKTAGEGQSEGGGKQKAVHGCCSL